MLVSQIDDWTMARLAECIHEQQRRQSCPVLHSTTSCRSEAGQLGALYCMQADSELVV